MNVLYVTPYVPSRIRTRPYHLIRALVGLGHEVTLLAAEGTSSEELEQAQELREWGVRVEVFPVSLARSLGSCLRALPTAEPLQAVYSHHPRMERRLGQLLTDGDYDVVHIEHLRAARLVRAVHHVPKVYDSVDCISLLFEQAAQVSPQRRSRLMTAVDLDRTRFYEAWLLTQYDRVVVTSRRDKEALEGLAGCHLPAEAQAAPITVVTNGVDLEYFRPPIAGGRRDGRTVVFTGKMSYHANVASALYFAQKVLPRVWAGDPAVRFEIVGKDPPEVLRKLASDGRIQVTGYVDDLRPYLARAAVAVCPALYAVGVQNKVLEAMAMGTPVVSTPNGCAALEAEDGREILVAEGEDELAAAVLRVLSDPLLAERLSAAGRGYAETWHSWEAGARRLTEVYEQARSEGSWTR
jgi:sugar transferase (PEP-CTERM/EpsH1 system associated)